MSHYAPHQLQDARRWLKAGGSDVKERAAKMSNLPISMIEYFIENDPICKAAYEGKAPPKVKPQTEIKPLPPKPPGPEVIE